MKFDKAASYKYAFKLSNMRCVIKGYENTLFLTSTLPLRSSRHNLMTLCRFHTYHKFKRVWSLHHITL